MPETDDVLQQYLSDHADYEEGDDDPRGYGKRVPYIGFYWRNIYLDESDREVSIGDCGGGFIGFMQSNKWGYPERQADDALVAEIREVVSRAITEGPHVLEDLWGVLERWWTKNA